MIRARKLGHVVLKVRDAEASKHFYTRTLGLLVASEDSSQGIQMAFTDQQNLEPVTERIGRDQNHDGAQEIRLPDGKDLLHQCVFQVRVKRA